jgi:hypothetical protein
LGIAVRTGNIHNTGCIAGSIGRDILITAGSVKIVDGSTTAGIGTSNGESECISVTIVANYIVDIKNFFICFGRSRNRSNCRSIGIGAFDIEGSAVGKSRRAVIGDQNIN